MDIKTLIGEVAKTHGLLLDEKDPIFVAVTLNTLLLNEYMATLNKSISGFQDNLTASQLEHIETAKNVSSQLITKSAQYFVDQVNKNSDEIARKLLDSISIELNKASKEANKAEKAKNVSFILLGFSLFSLAITIGLGLGKFF